MPQRDPACGHRVSTRALVRASPGVRSTGRCRISAKRRNACAPSTDESPHAWKPPGSLEGVTKLGEVVVLAVVRAWFTDSRDSDAHPARQGLRTTARCARRLAGNCREVVFRPGRILRSKAPHRFA